MDFYFLASWNLLSSVSVLYHELMVVGFYWEWAHFVGSYILCNLLQLAGSAALYNMGDG